MWPVAGNFGLGFVEGALLPGIFGLLLGFINHSLHKWIYTCYNRAKSQTLAMPKAEIMLERRLP